MRVGLCRNPTVWAIASGLTALTIAVFWVVGRISETEREVPNELFSRMDQFARELVDNPPNDEWDHTFQDTLVEFQLPPNVWQASIAFGSEHYLLGGRAVIGATKIKGVGSGNRFLRRGQYNGVQYSLEVIIFSQPYIPRDARQTTTPSR